jgi:hypothetical protein
MEHLTAGWIIWEAGKFLALYFLLSRTLSRPQVGMDGELWKRAPGLRMKLKGWLERLATMVVGR